LCSFFLRLPGCLLCWFLLCRFLFCRRLLARWRRFSAAAHGWFRFFDPGFRFGHSAFFAHAGFFFFFLFLLEVFFQRFAVGAAVAVLIHFIIPTVQGQIVKRHGSSCSIFGLGRMLAEAQGNRTTDGASVRNGARL